MSLSVAEQRRLRSIEIALTAEDPRLAKLLSLDPPQASSRNTPGRRALDAVLRVLTFGRRSPG